MSKLRLGFRMRKLFFSETQIKLLKECKIANQEDNTQWFTRNVATPLIIVCIPLIIQMIFPTNVQDFKTLIFNGSISLIGINVLFGMSTYLIKVNRQQKRANATPVPQTNQQVDGSAEGSDEKVEEKLNQDVVHLRARLDDYKNILVLIGTMFYIVQALYGRYKSEEMFYTFLILSTLILLLSIVIGRYMFIIKDDFFEKTFYGEYNDSVIQARTRWSQKF